MTQPAKVQEPSMEEILASIRRIIADDEAKPPGEKQAPPAAAALAPTPPKAEKPAAPPPPKPAMTDIPPSKIPAAEKKAASPPPPPPTPPPPAPASSATNSQDDIDALLNGLDEATTAEEIRPAQPDREVFELTDEMAVPSVAPPARPSFHKIEPQDDLEFTETPALRAVNRAPAYEPPTFDPQPHAPPAGPILSQSTVSAVESAFNTLAHTVLSNNARTLKRGAIALWPFRCTYLVAHDLFGKPLHTFPDRALAAS